MTIRERKNTGGACYGWGNVMDFDMDKRYGGKIVKEIDKGRYKQNILAPAKIAILREIAKAHDEETGGSHDVCITIYEREGK